jgi:hypothetical protein
MMWEKGGVRVMSAGGFKTRPYIGRALTLVSVTMLLAVVKLPAQDRPPPFWYLDPASEYPQSAYITGQGDGASADEAQSRALSQISLYFKSKVSSDSVFYNDYSETRWGAASESRQHSHRTERITVTSASDFFAVAFTPVYVDKKGAYHILAYIDRAKAAQIYKARIAEKLQEAERILEAYSGSPDPLAAAPHLEAARAVCEDACDYSSMLLVISGAGNPDTAARFAAVDAAIAANKSRMTAAVAVDMQPIVAQAVSAALRNAGLTIVDSGASYTAAVEISLSEGKTAHYITVTPSVAVTLKTADGSIALSWKKTYPAYRHVSRDEAVSRAYRNVAQDIAAELEARMQGKYGIRGES